jgi:hypothetical protein
MTVNGASRYSEVDIEDVGTDAFEAWGYVTLKVQRGEETLGVKVKIGSVPQESIDALRKTAPRPPSKTVMLDPSNPEHAAIPGVGNTRQKAIIPDYSDPEFQRNQEDFDLTFRREIVGRGVLSNLVLKNGDKAVNPEQRYRALEERGLSGIHFTEIAQQILALTQWTEDERTNFLSRGSASQKEKLPILSRQGTSS